MNIGQFIFNLVGIFLFLYVYWKKLKHDFPSTTIFNSAFTTIILVITGYFISRFFIPQWWFWISFFGAAIGTILGLEKFKLYKYETLEASILGFIFWMTLIALNDFLTTLDLTSIYVFIYLLFLIVIYFVVDKHYKKFRWYKSGRVGFSGLFILGVLFLSRSIIAITEHDMLSLLVGEIEVILSATVAFLSFMLLYNLSRKNI